MNHEPGSDYIARAAEQWRAHGWADAADGMAAITSMISLSHFFRSRIETALKPFRISFPQYELLAMLMFSQRGHLSMTRAGQRLQIPAPSATHLVSRLEADGLVTRSQNPHDRRGTLVSITDQGTVLVSSATPVLNEIFQDIGVSAADVSELLRICTKIRSANGEI